MTKREFNKLKKKECTDYKTTISFTTKCINDDNITFEMFEDLMDLITYYRIKEEIK